MTDDQKIENSKKTSIQERIESLLRSENIIPERPPSLDPKGHRLDVFPAQVKGRFRTYRNWVYMFLLFIFLILPWTRFAGQQTIHLNISARKFVFFGHTLFAHDGPYIFLLLGIVVFSLAFATAWFGRVWCGWACPQTVFIDTIYRRLEEWIEGNHLARKKLQNSPWTVLKVFKKTLKWTLYLILSVHIGHSFFAYFVGSEELLKVSLKAPAENLGLFIAVYIVSTLTLINFGWFREQFCLVACPYGRLQAALMDEKSISVFYDSRRGEPRREKSKVASGQKDYGDCVNCFKCVAVCPTGIDIRNGLQLECIACTACIDVCDEVMSKINKPKGLIRYASEKEIASGIKQSKAMGTRSRVYGLVVLALFSTLIVLLFSREEISVKVLRAVEAPYQLVQTAEGQIQILNHFKLHITNQTKSAIRVRSLSFDNLPNEEFSEPQKDNNASVATRVESTIEIVAPNLRVEIKRDSDVWVHMFVKFDASLLPAKQGKKAARWTLEFSQEEKIKKTQGVLNLIGPE